MAHKQQTARQPATKLPNLQKKLQKQQRQDKQTGGRRTGKTK
jgi:hypothetical protein